MKEKDLFMICIIISIIGIFILLIISNLQQPKLTYCSEITSIDIGQQVQIIGNISLEKSHNDFKIFILEQDSCKIEVTCFCKENISGEVEVTGTLEIYNDKIQIKAEKIKNIK
ncbi:MAG: hypothetical protein ABIH72_04935 [archaeon]